MFHFVKGVEGILTAPCKPVIPLTISASILATENIQKYTEHEKSFTSLTSKVSHQYFPIILTRFQMKKNEKRLNFRLVACIDVGRKN